MTENVNYCKIQRMQFWMPAFFLLAASSAFANSPRAGGSFQLNYFSLNNEKEFEVANEFIDRIQSFGFEKKISTTEFVPTGSEQIPAAEVFRKMMSASMPDGLVISGHHTGAFHGRRASAELGIETLEDLSCDPNYQPWFESIKALWLQGCRTLGVTHLSEMNNADFHTNRVGAALDEDGFEATLGALNLEFSNTLDAENPLFSRYLRVFPNATIFGWTATAPGSMAKSEVTLPYHIANRAKLDHPDLSIENPLGHFGATSARAFLDVFFSFLDGKQAVCKRSVDAWISTGNKQNRFAINNPDINGYTPLSCGGSPLLLKAKQVNCDLIRATSVPDKLEAALAHVLQSEQYLAYSYSSLQQLFKKLSEPEHAATLVRVKELIKSSPIFRNFVLSRLQSNRLGIAKKIEIYKFFQTVTGSKINALEEQIYKQLRVIISSPIRNQAEEDFRDEILGILEDQNMLGRSEILKLLHSSTLNDGGIAKLIDRYYFETLDSASQVDLLLDLVITHPNADIKTALRVLMNIGDLKFSYPRQEQIFTYYWNRYKQSSYAKQFLYPLAYINSPTPNAEEVWQHAEIDATDRLDIYMALSALGNKNLSFVGTEKKMITLMRSYLRIPRNWIDLHILNLLGRISSKIGPIDPLLDLILADPKKLKDTRVLNWLVYEIGKNPFMTTRPISVLERILDIESNDPNLIHNAIWTLGNLKEVGEPIGPLVIRLAANQNNGTLPKLCWAVSTNSALQNRAKLLKMVLQVPHAVNGDIRAFAEKAISLLPVVDQPELTAIIARLPMPSEAAIKEAEKYFKQQ